MIGNDLRSVVDANLQQDQQVVEFNDFLKETSMDHYCSSRATLDQVFAIDSTYQLPKHILTILQDRRSTTAMGIFLEIQRIWITSGTIVYFWDYVNRTLFTYETDDKIHQVGLVKAKTGIFSNTIEWILVVNSYQYITIYGVIIESSSGDMKLDISQRRSIQSGGVKMKSIVGHNSRILMLGADDGHIYEMSYKVDSSQDRLVCHTDQGLHTYFGISSLTSYFKSILDIKAKSITTDHQRNVIYSLLEDSTIQVICLDDGDVTFKFGSIITDINEQFVSLLLAPSKSDPMKMPSPSTLDVIGSPLAPKPFDIIAIHTVPKQYTPTTHDIAFYAVTSHGCRLYFTSNEPNNIITEKSTFVLKYVRLAPYENDQPSVLQLPSERLESTFQLQNDIFVAPISGKCNKLWVTSYQQQWCQGNTKVEETSDVMKYESSIVIVGQHISKNAPTHSSSTFYEHTNTSISMAHHQFIVVTNNGNVTTYKKQRPVDLVYQSISTNTNFDSALRRFGQVETYAMLLDILSINSTLASTHQHLLHSLAKNHPYQVNQALALVYTRVVACIWKKDILTGDDKDDVGRLLVKCKTGLEKVYTLVNTSVFSGHAYEDALELLNSSIQVISFVTLLKNHQMLTREPCRVNDMIFFGDLVTTTKGHNILETLVKKAIHYFASTDQEVMVSAYLVEHCPTLFGDANHLALYEGDEYLAIGEYIGKVTGGSLTQQQHDKTMTLLEKSLNKYLDGIDYLMQDARTRICDTYKILGYYQGVVTFSMHAADHPPMVSEPTSTLSLLNNTTMTGCIKDDQISPSNSMDGVIPILSLLDHVNDTASSNLVSLLRMTLPIYSHHKILHHAIYTWLIEHDKMQLLFDEEGNDERTTHYLTQFLEHDCDNKPVGMDYLYKYYSHQGDQEKALTCLTTLAMDIRGISLTQRIHYLNLARAYESIDQQQRLVSLQSQYQLATVQQNILDRLLEKQNNGSSDVEVDDRLLSRLLDLDDLLKDYAEKYGIWDQALVLMNLAHKTLENVSDFATVKTAWSNYLSQQSLDDLDNFRSRFVALGKQLYPSIITFPIYLIVLLIEPVCLSAGTKNGFVVDLLMEIGVPESVLEDAYEFIMYNKLSTMNDDYVQQQLEYLKTSS